MPASPFPRVDELLDASTARLSNAELPMGHAADWPDDVKAVLILDHLMLIRRCIAKGKLEVKDVQEIYSFLGLLMGGKSPHQAIRALVGAIQSDMQDLQKRA